MPHFILWIAAPSKSRPGYTDKLPVSPLTGRVCDSQDQQHHVDEQTARQAAARWPGTRLGYVFTPNCNRWFLDIDHCLVDGQWSRLAQQICAATPGCYLEVSQSGTGLHVIGSGQPPNLQHGTRNGTYNLEIYTSGRFCALTGLHAQGSMAHPAQPQLDWLLSFPGWSASPTASRSTPADWTDAPDPTWTGPTDDNDLINRMLLSRPSAASAMGNRATLAELWCADPDALSRCYPDPRGYDASSADAALCSHLAFWTGKDCERMDRLFRMSSLYRDKWDQRADYRQNTILKSVSLCRNVLGDRDRQQPATQPATQPNGPQLTGTSGLCSVSEQGAFFADCVYIRDLHRVWVPDGAMLKPEQFKVQYGGRSFFLDAQGGKTTKDAWECFTQSQAITFPKATTACFRPELPAGAIIEEEGRKVVNTYRPIDTLRLAGDPTKFTDLLTKMLPNTRDRSILTSYLAALVQHPGKKFQWWPVLQGTQGNGKSAIIRCLEHAVGKRYTHLPDPTSMAKTGNQFNGWVQGKLFIGIEEIYVNDRRDFLETFKATVTNERLSMEGKGLDQVMGDNRANGIMCTNHKDGVPVDTDTRRYAILFTAQQSKADKLRDGMGDGYFPDLYDWLKGEGVYSNLGAGYGYAVVNNWLREYQVAAEFDPAGLCQEAPQTSSTQEAIELSRGAIEQEIQEAIDSCKPGFCGGWVSSAALNRLLEERRAASKIPRNRRRALMQSLGYDWHPGLKNGGRVWNPIQDCGFMDKPVLYCRVGGLVGGLVGGAEIVRHYLEAQAGSSEAGAALGAAACK